MARWRFGLAVTAAVLALALVEAAGPTSPAPNFQTTGRATLGSDVESLTLALGDYIELFNEESSAVVAEERYVQLRHGWRGNLTGPDSEPALAWRLPGEGRMPAHVTGRVQLLSDMVFVHLKDGDWIDFRDVAEVNGKPVRNRTQRVLDLFLSGTPDAMTRARRIADEGARHNMPGLYRTLNLPNVVLYFMRPAEHGRYAFKRAKDEILEGRQARVLEFREKARPTIVRTSGGDDIPIRGRVWMDAERGSVLRTELSVDRGRMKSLIRVDYQRLSGLHVLVPAQMWEWHEDRMRDGEMVQGVPRYYFQGLATYSGHKRFVVTTKEAIK